MSQGGGKEGLLEEAAAWFARMRGPDAEASRTEFEAWLARGALHRAAYNRASEIFAMGKLLGEEPAPNRLYSRRLARRATPLFFAAAAAALLVAVTGGWLLLQPVPADRPGRTANSSSIHAELGAGGAPQSIRLIDRSLVKLQAGARIAIDFGPGLRRLEIERGSARFFVAHEPRPFVVLAGGGSVTAHGTVFDVGLGADRRVSVRLIEGSIEVTLPHARGSRAKSVSRRLRPGETLSYVASPGAHEAAPAARQEPESGLPANPVADAPQDIDGVRLADLIAAANQGAVRPIRLSEPALGNRRVSGRFRIHDTELLAARIARLFDLAIDRTQRTEIVLKPR